MELFIKIVVNGKERTARVQREDVFLSPVHGPIAMVQGTVRAVKAIRLAETGERPNLAKVWKVG